MPSNYTIAKILKQVAYYREICDRNPGQYQGTAMEVQSLHCLRHDKSTKKTTPWAAQQHQMRSTTKGDIHGC